MANGKWDSLGWRRYLQNMWNPFSKNVDIKRITVFEPKLAALDILVVQLHCGPWDRRREGGCLVQRGALAEVMLLNESGLNSSILPAWSFIVREIRMR